VRTIFLREVDVNGLQGLHFAFATFYLQESKVAFETETHKILRSGVILKTGEISLSQEDSDYK
jgi:hypothetical protein